MGSATQLAQHDRRRDLSKGSPQLRGSSRGGAEAQNTSSHLSKDSIKLGKFFLEYGGHQEKTTGSRGAEKTEGEKPVGGAGGEEEEGGGGEEQKSSAGGRSMLRNIRASYFSLNNWKKNLSLFLISHLEQLSAMETILYLNFKTLPIYQMEFLRAH